MEKIKAALILSSDITIRNHFAALIEKTGNACMLESLMTRALMRVLEYPFSFIVIDVDTIVSEVTDFIHVLNHLRPRLPVLIVMDEDHLDYRESFMQEGVVCCLLKGKAEAGISQKLIQMFDHV